MAVDSAYAHETAATVLRAKGQLYTNGRRDLIELLAGLDRPATVPELLALGSRLTQSSLYRNLADLESAGLVQRVSGADSSARYELAEPLLGHHHHTVCVSCGAIDDLSIPEHTERLLHSTITRTASAVGFHAEEHRLEIFGRCPDCTS